MPENGKPLSGATPTPEDEVKWFRAWLRGRLYPLLGAHTDFEDAMQEGVLAMWQASRRPDPPCRRMTYIFRRGQWAALTYLASPRASCRPTLRSGPRTATAAARQAPLLLGADAEGLWGPVTDWEQVVNRIAGQQLWALLQREATPRQQELIRATVLAGRTPEAMAKEEGVSVAGIRHTVQRGINNARRALGLPLYSTCKEHDRSRSGYAEKLARTRQWKRDHRDRVRAQNRASYARHRGKILAQKAAYDAQKKGTKG